MLNTILSSKIDRNIHKLLTIKENIIEKEVATERIIWFNNYIKNRNFHPKPNPRDAFNMFFFDYIGLDQKELPILFESENKIEWSSLNKCSTLEACVRANLDTRHICRAIFEKPTQLLISKLDPELRFHRSYEEIRPYSHHCRELIVRIDFEKYMKFALKEAQQSIEEGNKGYGAVLLMGEQILSLAHDTAITENDPSKHAEVNAIINAVRAFGDTNLCGGILFTTCEPCPMCTSLAVWANITTIVYGISIKETLKLGRTRINLSSKEIINKSPVLMEVIGDVLKETCKELYIGKSV